MCSTINEKSLEKQNPFLKTFEVATVDWIKKNYFQNRNFIGETMNTTTWISTCSRRLRTMLSYSMGCRNFNSNKQLKVKGNAKSRKLLRCLFVESQIMKFQIYFLEIARLFLCFKTFKEALLSTRDQMATSTHFDTKILLVRLVKFYLFLSGAEISTARTQKSLENRVGNNSNILQPFTAAKKLEIKEF